MWFNMSDRVKKMTHLPLFPDRPQYKQPKSVIEREILPSFEVVMQILK